MSNMNSRFCDYKRRALTHLFNNNPYILNMNNTDYVLQSKLH